MSSGRVDTSSGRRRNSREGSSSSLITMGTIASTLEEARASLKQPSRPFTPAQDERHMFTSNNETNYQSRPSTAYGIVDSSNFLDGLRPTGSASRLAPITAPSTPKEVENDKPERSSETRRRERSSGSKSVSTPTSNPSTPTSTPPANLVNYFDEPEKKDQRRSKKNDMDNLRATLEAAIPATPPTTPREPNGEGGEGGSNAVKPSTAAWIKIKDILPTLDLANGTEAILKGLAQLEEILTNLSTAMGGSRPLSTPKAKYVLERLFRLTDAQDTVLLFRLCKLIYTITDGATHLLNVVKLLYKLSKTAENDDLFRKEKIIELLVDIISKEKDLSSKLLVYGIGTLKNVTNSEPNQRTLAEAVSVFAALRHILIASLDFKGDDKIAQLLIQVTATLRNLSMSKGTRQYMSDIITHLCSVLNAFKSHMEVVSNIVRIFGKVTLTSDNQRTLSQSPHSIEDLLKILQTYAENEALVLRTCFILGNITVNQDENRKKIFYTYNGMKILTPLLAKYDNIDVDNFRWLAKASSSEVDAKEAEKRSAKLKTACKETEQALVKLVRLLANLAINEEIGQAMAVSEDIVILCKLLERKDIKTSEELVLNVVGAITNLSFYTGRDSVILKQQLNLTRLLIPLLLFKNEEAIVESVRAYGNISRDASVRKVMKEQRLDSMLTMLLDHNNTEIVLNACGVLMNLVVDPDCRDFVSKEGVIERLVDRLVATEFTDITLCETICKALFNLTVVVGKGLFTGVQIEHICKFLSESLDIIASQDSNIYEELPPPGEEDVKIQEDDQHAYAPFKQVANQLLECFQ